MAEEQDITQVDQTSIDIPNSDLVESSTTEDDKPKPTIKPDPTFRKKIWNGLKELNDRGTIRLELKSEQEFYAKLDADQEYARQLYYNLKKVVPANNIDQDESVFLSKIYGKPTKPANSGMAANEKMTTTDNKPAKVEEVPAWKLSLNTPAQVEIAKKELDANNGNPTPYQLANGKTVIFKYNSNGAITAEYATHGEKATDKLFAFNKSYKNSGVAVMSGFDKLYYEAQDAQKYFTTGGVAESMTQVRGLGNVNKMSPATSQQMYLWQNKLNQYNDKVKKIHEEFDKLIKYGINEKNYKRWLTTDNNGVEVVSQEKIANLSTEILSLYGVSDPNGLLTKILKGKLETYISAYPGMLAATKNTEAKLKAKLQAEQNNALNKAQNEQLLTKKEIAVNAKSLSNEAKIKGNEISKPYLDQIKTLYDQQKTLNDNYEADSKKFLSTLIETDPDIKALYDAYLSRAKSLENSSYNNQERDSLNKSYYNDFQTKASPFFEARFKEFNDKYKASFDQLNVQINDIASEMNLKLGDLNKSYNDKFRTYQEQRIAQGNAKIADIKKQLESQGVSAELADEYARIWKEEFDKIQSNKKKKLEDENIIYDIFTPARVISAFGKITWNNFGSTLENWGTTLDIDAMKIVGAEMNRGEYGFSMPDLTLSDWKDITNPYKLAGSSGQLIGRMAPQVGGQILLGYATRGRSLFTRGFLQAVAGYTFETVDMYGGKYNDMMIKTGDPLKARNAANNLAKLNLMLLPTYALEVLPFFAEFKNIVKGKSLFSYAGRGVLGGGTEAFTETIQEYSQNAFEKKVELDAMYNADVSLTDILFTNGKTLTDKSGNVLIDQEYQTTIKTNASSDLKNTFLNVAPASFLMAALPSAGSYGMMKYEELSGKRMFAKYKLGLVNNNLAKQKVFEILLTRGENTAGAFLTAMQTSGMVSQEEFNEMLSSLESMQNLSGLARREKLDNAQTMILGALMFEVKSQENALANPEITEEEKGLIEERLKAAKNNFDNALKGKKSDYVVFRVGNTDHIITYDQLGRLMDDQEFVNNTKGAIQIAVLGSGVNAQGENLKEKAMKVFGIQPPSQEQIDNMEQNGPPVMDIFANTEIPNLNTLVNDLEERMNNAEEIDEKDMNSAIAGLYQQLQDILDNHYNTENGKRAAQMLMDTIEKFEDYEFTTKEETVSTTERTTTQSIREVVNASKNIFGRITGTAKSGAKKFATIVTGFKQRGKYSVEINEKDEVVLTPMSGAPIILGNKNELNGKVKFVGSSFSGKTGKISTITFRVNEANENGVMPEVTLSTADGFTYDELLDIAIDLRAMEVGEVTTEEFDNVVEQVTTGKSYPNMGRSEQKQKAKAEAEAAAQQQAPQQEAPQQTEEQINQEVQRLQAQQDEELRAAQDMTKSSNLAKNKMTLNEALKARDEKIKQIKSKYKVLIDNAKKGIIQETQQQEAEQQQQQQDQQQQQQNNDVVDITSDNIDELQNIETANKFQKRVLNAIPNMLKALGKIVPGIKVSIHLTTQSYRNSVVKDSKGTNDGRGTKGYYWKGTINLDLSNINSIDGVVTAFHEAFHGMYQVLDEDLQNILYKSIQTIIFRNGFRLFSIKTRSSFDKFAKQYKDHQQQEEAVVEFLGHMASGAVTLTVPGYKMFIEALNKILDKIGLGSFKFTTSNQAKDFARGVVNAMKTGQDIGELTAPLTKKQQGQQDISFRREDAEAILSRFKQDYNNGNLEKNRNGGSRNLGVYEYEGGIIKLVKRNRRISESQINLMQERLGDMNNVYAPYSSIELQDGVFAMIMNKAKGVDAAKLNQQEIDNIPQEHWDKFENDIRELSSRGVQTDLTKRSNLFYDKKTGFHFIDIEGISIEGESTNKFFEKDGIEYYYAFEKYPFFGKVFNGGKNMFENIPSDNKTDISFRKDTADIFDQVNNLKEKVQEAENTTEKRKFASERRDILAENPSVKLIDDNFNSIVEQLKNNEEFEFKGPCF